MDSFYAFMSVFDLNSLRLHSISYILYIENNYSIFLLFFYPTKEKKPEALEWLNEKIKGLGQLRTGQALVVFDPYGLSCFQLMVYSMDVHSSTLKDWVNLYICIKMIYVNLLNV